MSTDPTATRGLTFSQTFNTSASGTLYTPKEFEDKLLAAFDPALIDVPIDGARVELERSSFAYDGEAKEPAVKSVTLNGKKLKAGADYEVSYKNNKKPGKATVTVTGKGNYRGSVKAAFTIKKVKSTKFLTAGGAS